MSIEVTINLREYAQHFLEEADADDLADELLRRVSPSPRMRGDRPCAETTRAILRLWKAYNATIGGDPDTPLSTAARLSAQVRAGPFSADELRAAAAGAMREIDDNRDRKDEI